jgi:hypothetical protein
MLSLRTATCLSSHYYILVLLHVCPHTTIYLSSYHYICVRRRTAARTKLAYCNIFVLKLPRVCPHTTLCVRKEDGSILADVYCYIYVSHYYICVLTPLHMCAQEDGSILAKRMANARKVLFRV